jgi:hypothetical protein
MHTEKPGRYRKSDEKEKVDKDTGFSKPFQFLIHAFASLGYTFGFTQYSKVLYQIPYPFTMNFF